MLVLCLCVMTTIHAGCSGGDGGSQGDIESQPSLLSYRLHGLNFSPYMGNQDPNQGAAVTADQVEQRMRIIAPYTQWIRTYGCTRGLEHSGAIARRLQLKIAMGAWIGPNPAANDIELENLIREAQSGRVDLAVIGSEVLYRGDLEADDLIAYIRRFRAEVLDVPVTTADVYADLLEHPEVMAACDVILANYYPYWEGADLNDAVAWLHVRHQRLVAEAGGKTVFVSETGWPSAGDTKGDAVPSFENAAFYFKNFVSWARTEGVDYFYFEAFDETWKAAYEGTQGAHWGVWEADGNLKTGMQEVFDGKTMGDNWTCGDIPGGTGMAAIELTSVPPTGSFDNLHGRVWHVTPTEYGVAVYINVSGGWWTKPYFKSPVTSIHCDGTWACDITTGGSDEWASAIAAFLVPLSYSPPSAAGQVYLPTEIYSESAANVEVPRN